jgi:hypothetical protein
MRHLKDIGDFTKQQKMGISPILLFRTSIRFMFHQKDKTISIADDQNPQPLQQIKSQLAAF